VIIGRYSGYHGSTMAGARLWGMGGVRAGRLPIPNIFVIEPTTLKSGKPGETDGFGIRATAWLEEREYSLWVQTR
jgi:putrescine aminotransferase